MAKEDPQDMTLLGLLDELENDIEPLEDTHQPGTVQERDYQRRAAAVIEELLRRGMNANPAMAKSLGIDVAEVMP
jgi:hypothetical protein